MIYEEQVAYYNRTMQFILDEKYPELTTSLGYDILLQEYRKTPESFTGACERASTIVKHTIQEEYKRWPKSSI